MFPKQLALSGDFLLVTAFWGDGHHWYLVSKGQGCYCTPENGFLKTVQCTGQPPPHTPRMIQPKLSMVPRIKKNSVCPPLLAPLFLVLTPLVLPPKPFPPQLLLHTPLFSYCLCPLLTNHHQQQGQSDKVWERGQERGHIWRESLL